MSGEEPARKGAPLVPLFGKKAFALAYSSFLPTVGP